MDDKLVCDSTIVGRTFEWRSSVLRCLDASLLCDAQHLESLDVDELAALFSYVIISTLDQLTTLRSVTVRRRLSDQWFHGKPVFTSTTHRLPSFSSVSIDDVLKVIRSSTDNQSHLDPMPTWLLKDTADTTAPFIARLVNLPLSSGKVPATFKRAAITPLLKKSGMDASDIKSYRPNSNLPVLSELLERAVAQQLVSYLDTNKFFPDRN